MVSAAALMTTNDLFQPLATLVRLAFGVLTCIWFLGILLYLLAWAIIPEQDEDHSIVESFINKTMNK